MTGTPRETSPRPTPFVRSCDTRSTPSVVTRSHGRVIEGVLVGTRREWRLYCQHRDFRWHAYQELPAASRFAELLDEVDVDPTGIFWR